MKTISVAKNFSNHPAGRTPEDGPNSGERFRNDFIAPELRKGAVHIILDAEGYGSSFLEEAFGGLIRLGFPFSVIMENLTFTTEDDTLRVEIGEYIKDAAVKAGQKV